MLAISLSGPGLLLHNGISWHARPQLILWVFTISLLEPGNMMIQKQTNQESVCQRIIFMLIHITGGCASGQGLVSGVHCQASGYLKLNVCFSNQASKGEGGYKILQTAFVYFSAARR